MSKTAPPIDNRTRASHRGAALLTRVRVAWIKAASLGSIFTMAALLTLGASVAADSTRSDERGTVQVPAFALPESSFLNEEARAELRRANQIRSEEVALRRACPQMEGARRADMPAIRKCHAEAFYKTSEYKRVRERYDVTVTAQDIGGVYTEVFTPKGGISQKNAKRVLINVHGGAFVRGSRTTSHLESIPIASVGKIKVVSIDYRMAPEYTFPAASEDVAAVYRELLKAYAPQNIGIYGCSAGGLLTAESVAWLQKEGLPRPGAVGMFCEGGGYWTEGDMGHFGAALEGPSLPFRTIQENPYFKNVDPNEPLAFPVRSKEVLAKFPPSLLISSTRDLALSSVVHTHSLLVQLGVEGELHVWEGLGHAFFMNPALPQSREVYEVVVKFFDKHLGPPHAAAQALAPDLDLEKQLAAEVDRFAAADKASPPAPCQVLFVGSSSIVKWTTLAADLAPLPVINRGFGGSHIEYVNRWFDQVVALYRPRTIVFYAGENDLAVGKSAERVMADFDEFMARKTAALGRTPVYFISLKPSNLRFEQFALQTQVNNMVRARAEERRDLHYIDVVTPMLEEGKPKSLFTSDDLHMTPGGYAIWTQAVRAALLANAEAEACSCHRRMMQ